MEAGKVKGAHGADCRGINPKEDPCVSMVDPLGRDATKGFFWTRHATKRDPRVSGPHSMKAHCAMFFQTPPSNSFTCPSLLDTSPAEDKTNPAKKYLVDELLLSAIFKLTNKSYQTSRWKNWSTISNHYKLKTVKSFNVNCRVCKEYMQKYKCNLKYAITIKRKHEVPEAVPPWRGSVLFREITQKPWWLTPDSDCLFSDLLFI